MTETQKTKGALDHVNVLDLSWVAAGPLCGVLMAYYGATVVKLESAVRIDVARGAPPLAGGQFGINKSGYFGALNLGKYSVAADLNNPSGREIAQRLVDWADVIIEGFTPGTVERWGLDYPTLSKRKPSTIMVSLTLQGQTGPYALLRGYGFQVMGMSGMASLIGWPDSSPTGVTLAYPDYIVPMLTIFATVAALDYRDRTGQGQHIDLSQMEALINFTGPATLDYMVNGRLELRAGNRLIGGDTPYAAPHGVYPTQGDDRWISIAVSNQEEWQTLCRVLGQQKWLTDPRFGTPLDRCHHDAELDAAIAEETQKFEGRRLMEALQKVEVAAGVVLDQRALFEDPQLNHRGHFVPIVHPEWGEYPAELFGARLSETPPAVQRPAPCLGQHNEYVLQEILGYSREEFDQLVADGALEFYGGD
jgi:crotonobetainyl-CoA:carnitine CoA-transferase CaiB-like acyl-CoA transferase